MSKKFEIGDRIQYKKQGEIYIVYDIRQNGYTILDSNYREGWLPTSGTDIFNKIGEYEGSYKELVIHVHKQQIAKVEKELQEVQARLELLQFQLNQLETTELVQV